MADEEEHPTETTICVFCVAGFPHIVTDICKTGESAEVIARVAEEAVKQLGRPQADPSVMADALSTGRKRAAIVGDIPVGMVCEWALLKEAGGGVEPIKGCTGYPAEHRHHGPDKNTLNNERAGEDRPINLHLICTYCHNRWHAANDKHYEGERPKDDTPWLPTGDFKPHNPIEKMTRKEAQLAELMRTK